MLLQTLVAIDALPLRRRVQRILDGMPVVHVRAVHGRDLWKELSRFEPDLVLVDRGRLPDPVESGVQAIRASAEQPEVVVLSARDDAKDRAALLAAGSLAVLHRDLPDAELGEAIAAFVERRRSERIGLLRVGDIATLRDFVSESPAMRQFLATVHRLVNSGSSLLLLGETGTGKERLARAMHAEGPRRRGPFVAVNVAALPEGLLESELFGHEQGSFTGAVRTHRGCFEMAHEGTLFLDEMGELPSHLQSKLLRVLEERKVVRVGGEAPIAVDVRVTAATNRDLEEEVRARRFRADLYYRLAVVTLTLPPLRERREDIPELARDHLDHFRVALGRDVRSLHPDAMAALVEHNWPGNVRELINVMERAVLLCPGPEIHREDLPRSVTGPPATRSGAAPFAPDDAWRDRTLSQARREMNAVFERTYLEALLRSCSGRVGEAARRAGINERTLYELMRRHRLKKEDFR